MWLCVKRKKTVWSQNSLRGIQKRKRDQLLFMSIKRLPLTKKVPPNSCKVTTFSTNWAELSSQKGSTCYALSLLSTNNITQIRLPALISNKLPRLAQTRLKWLRIQQLQRYHQFPEQPLTSVYNKMVYISKRLLNTLRPLTTQS